MQKKISVSNTNINFFVQHSEKIQLKKGINLYFVILFSIFVSIFLYLLIVLFYDLIDQVNSRVNPAECYAC